LHTISTGDACVASFGYSDTATVGTKVYFAPAVESRIGVLDTVNSSFSTIPLNLTSTGCWGSDDLGHSTWQRWGTPAGPGNAQCQPNYWGATAVGTKVVFAPHWQDNVGVLDTTTSAFSTYTTRGAWDGGIDIDGEIVTGGYKYDGAAAVGTAAYFAPFNQDNVGVFDTQTSQFSTISTKPEGVRGSGKYRGAAAVGTTVFFAPYNENNVGVVDTVSRTFLTIRSPQLAAASMYHGAAAHGTKVYFAYAADGLKPPPQIGRAVVSCHAWTLPWRTGPTSMTTCSWWTTSA
jgi:hypothetical protein